MLIIIKFLFTKWGTSLQMEMFTMPEGDFPLFISILCESVENRLATLSQEMVRVRSPGK